MDLLDDGDLSTAAVVIYDVRDDVVVASWSGAAATGSSEGGIHGDALSQGGSDDAMSQDLYAAGVVPPVCLYTCLHTWVEMKRLLLLALSSASSPQVQPSPAYHSICSSSFCLLCGLHLLAHRLHVVQFFSASDYMQSEFSLPGFQSGPLTSLAAFSSGQVLLF